MLSKTFKLPEHSPERVLSDLHRPAWKYATATNVVQKETFSASDGHYVKHTVFKWLQLHSQAKRTRKRVRKNKHINYELRTED
jgi:hypothetical protein